jgi:hypothetical protein
MRGELGQVQWRRVVLVDSKRSYSVMKSMIDNETCSDVVFVLKDGERLHANKGLLIARSRGYVPIRYERGRENEVGVGDCPKRVFVLFLEYLYLGNVNFEIEEAMELYVLSDLYQEGDLSRQCLEVIRRGLSDANVIEWLAEADALGLDALKDVCMEFMVSNGNSIKEE